MSIRKEWINRLRHVARHSEFDSDLDVEIRFHLETRATELEASGLRHADAMAQARREFGNIALSQEDSRAPWQFRWLQDLVADVQYSVRTCLRSPLFTLTAILSLALGIGANTAIYTALDAILWKPLPVADPGRLVSFSLSREKGRPETDLPAAFVSQLRDSGVFAGLAVNIGDGLSFSLDGRAERIIGETVAPDFFSVLGVPVMLGQAFSPDLRAVRWAPEAVLSYHFWKRRFGGDPSIIGRTIHLNTYPFTVVGVSPPWFFGLTRGSDYEVRIPQLPPGRDIPQIEQISGNQGGWLGVIARLKPGVGMAQAEAAADAQFQDFLRTTPFPRFQNAGLRHLQLLPAARGYDEYVRPFHAPLSVLLGLVAIVLLIACCNVGGMLLARGSVREREFAIRTSIGAGRFRLIRQMLTESILLGMIGGALGLAVAWWAADVLFHFLPQGHIALAVDLRPDSRALLFTFGLSLVAGVLFGLAPALQASSGSLARTMKQDSAASPGPGSSARLRRAMVVSQVAFCLLLLIATGIFVRTVQNLRPADYRHPDRILLFTLKPQPEIYSDQQKLRLASELIRRMSSLPGVQAVALAENGPLGSRTGEDSVQVPGHNAIHAGSDNVGPGFFETLGIPLVMGRDFNAGDKPGTPVAVIVNLRLARLLFANENPLGRTVRIPVGKLDGDYQVVGVAADTHYYDVHKDPEPFVWLCSCQTPPYMPTLHVRTGRADTASVIAEVRHEFDQIDTGFPIFNIRSMAVRIEDSLAGERMVANLSGAFGILALALASVGLYGILAYSVARRTREIGIRMALGARSRSVLWLVAREAFTLVGIGGVAGLLLALVGARLLSRYVVGVASLDPAVAALAASVLLIVTAAAVVIPGVRGCRIDPLTALRHE